MEHVWARAPLEISWLPPVKNHCSRGNDMRMIVIKQISASAKTAWRQIFLFPTQGALYLCSLLPASQGQKHLLQIEDGGFVTNRQVQKVTYFFLDSSAMGGVPTIKDSSSLKGAETTRGRFLALSRLLCTVSQSGSAFCNAVTNENRICWTIHNKPWLRFRCESSWQGNMKSRRVATNVKV